MICKDGFQILLVVQFQEVIMEIENILLYYVTFFKPWRTGKDLKLEDQNWDDAFENHVFSTMQLEKMKYFNVRYECLDARDDYAAQMKKVRM